MEQKREENLNVWEKHPSKSCLTGALTRNQTHNPGVCPDQRSNQQTFTLQEGTRQTEPHWSGHYGGGGYFPLLFQWWLLSIHGFPPPNMLSTWVKEEKIEIKANKHCQKTLIAIFMSIYLAILKVDYLLKCLFINSIFSLQEIFFLITDSSLYEVVDPFIMDLQNIFAY